MRPATATIDREAIRHNLGRVRALAPDSRVVAVVKSNGYGHGAQRILPALDDADLLGVACIEEALALREAGARQAIVLLEGVFHADELALCATHDFQIAVHSPEQIAMLRDGRVQRALTVWLKLDSGMGRLGFLPADLAAAWSALNALDSVWELRLMSHFANADDPGDAQTRAQMTLADRAFRGLSAPRSLCNSAGVLAWPRAHADWVRPGVMLYGISPMVGRTGADENLRPAMTVRSALISVKTHAAGAMIGYGGTFTCPESMPVGIVAMGYGDGYPRHAGTGTPILVNGVRTQLVGRVSMDMLAVDLRPVAGARVGDAVTLWGDGLPIEHVATAADTIAYELVCGVTARVHVQVVG